MGLIATEHSLNLEQEKRPLLGTNQAQQLCVGKNPPFRVQPSSPTRCCYKQGVVTNRNVVTNQVLLPIGCCYQLGVVTNRVLLPTGCCYQPGVVTNRVLLPTGCCYKTGVVTNQVLLPISVVTNRLLLPSGCCYQHRVLQKQVTSSRHFSCCSGLIV